MNACLSDTGDSMRSMKIEILKHPPVGKAATTLPPLAAPALRKLRTPERSVTSTSASLLLAKRPGGPPPPVRSRLTPGAEDGDSTDITYGPMDVANDRAREKADQVVKDVAMPPAVIRSECVPTGYPNYISIRFTKEAVAEKFVDLINVDNIIQGLSPHHRRAEGSKECRRNQFFLEYF